MPKLSGRQYEALTEALVDAFPTPPKLAMMLQFKLAKALAAIALGDDQTEIVFKVIGDAEAKGWTARLVAAAREHNPGNPRLLLVAQELGLAPAAPPRSDLEALLKRENAPLDLVGWRARLGELEYRVCRIEVPSAKGTGYGTGFLVGPGAVLTNHHVMQSVISGAARAADVVLRFDYKRLPDGTTINPGTEYRLASGWNLDDSPPSAVDHELDPKSREPAADELDHCLVRVDGEPGREAIGGKGGPDAAKRGWIDIEHPAPLTPSTPLFILQHPEAAPLSLGIDQVTAITGEGRRVRYTAPTQPGSSGSPCFDVGLRPVALHHAGEPNYNPAYNEGIPIAAILSLLEQRGKKHLIGAQPD